MRNATGLVAFDFLLSISSVANCVGGYGRFPMRVPEVGVIVNRIVEGHLASLPLPLCKRGSGFALDAALAADPEDEGFPTRKQTLTSSAGRSEAESIRSCVFAAVIFCERADCCSR